MAKDPAFLFYPGDWLGGTMGMTFEQKGAYMELLMLQFNRGHMTLYMIGQTVGGIWDGIQDKFIKDENGCWYNERLEVEKTKRKVFTASRVNNRSGKNQHTKESGHMTNHMENENENLWTTVSKNFFNDFKWIEKFCITQKIKPDYMKVKMQEFTTEIELREDWKTLKDLKDHFFHWYSKHTENNKNKQTLQRIGRPIDEILKERNDFMK